MINKSFSWKSFKTFVDSRNLSIQWVEDEGSYFLTALDSYFSINCILNKNNINDELTDFETNYKANGNKSPILSTNIQTQPPYGSKSIIVNGVIKKLFTRFTGIQYSLVQGDNELTYTATYPWGKLIGIEAIGCESLDYVDFKVYDNDQGTYSGVPNLLLNQFSFALNLPKDFYRRMAQFDADIYQGMVIKIIYHSNSAKTIGINYLLNEVKS